MLTLQTKCKMHSVIRLSLEFFAKYCFNENKERNGTIEKWNLDFVFSYLLENPLRIKECLALRSIHLQGLIKITVFQIKFPTKFCFYQDKK